MKTITGLTHITSSLLATSVLVALAQPALASPTQIRSIQTNQTQNGIEVVLETEVNGRPGAKPQVFTLRRGNSWVADLTNTQLQLPTGNAFRQDKPAPGISTLEVQPLDANSVRVTVTGENSSPQGQLSRREGGGLVFSLASGTAASAAPVTPAPASPAPTRVAQAQPGVPAPGAPVRPQNPAPPFIPRAAAPPLGDIAISSVTTAPGDVRLDSNERVPRLVLRDAPAREVLSLLARAAGMNLAYSDAAATTPGSAGSAMATTPGATAGAGAGPRISLDVENESVQDVFNYVLRLTGLEANRVGRTIFVGPKLPDGARNLISRTLRMNQITAITAAQFLSTLGAETAVSLPPRPEIVTITIPGVGGAPGTTQTITRDSAPTITPLVYEPKNGVAPLLGLQVSTNDRMNSVTLVGTPSKVEMATAYLSQLDLRRRQVAVNVKIIDVNLSNNQNATGSFSFGLNDSFVVSDGGVAAVNFGNIRPAPAINSLTSPPTVTNSIVGTPLLDPNNPLLVPGVGNVPRGVSPLSPDGSPLTPGISAITPTVTTIVPGPPPITQTTLGSVTFSLPTLFQYPTKFLARLQSQVLTGNAKILTDPTLTVQEGQSASVNLTQEVFAGTQETISQGTAGAAPLITRNVLKQEVGLILNVAVERIDDNGFVTLLVSPDVRSIGGTYEIEGQPPAILTARRQLSSGSIRLRDGQTLILAGIIQEQDRQTVSKIPILGDLPIIGALFRSSQGNNTRTEVIVVLTPQILDDSAASAANYGFTPSPDARGLMQRQ